MTFFARSFSAAALRAGICLLAAALVSCGSSPLERGVSDWNDAGVWKRVAGEGAGASYVPRDLPARAEQSSANGTWVTDPNDGCRFFVPDHGTKAYSPGILRAEVKKATNPQVWARKKDAKLPQSPYDHVRLRGPNDELDEREAARRAAAAARADQEDRLSDTDNTTKQAEPVKSPAVVSIPTETPNPPQAPEQGVGALPRPGR